MYESQDFSLFVFLCVVSDQQIKFIITTQEGAIGQKSNHVVFLVIEPAEHTPAGLQMPNNIDPVYFYTWIPTARHNDSSFWKYVDTM